MTKLRHDVARRDHYEELTNTIIAKLEDGVLPWRRPWDPRKCSAAESPTNPVTGRAYRGSPPNARGDMASASALIPR